ncbi:hypothetical protein AKJ09_06075 [Labilithrix luteola]|uniref:Uncharacterized protein n=1 Tax=Labilithrix luteola TaxID=1391654 RepID=A0A0K1Q1A9_9BACT|nr:hypothetical protein AKJ09_06075 [Labilithrix luteola]
MLPGTLAGATLAGATFVGSGAACGTAGGSGAFGARAAKPEGRTLGGAPCGGIGGSGGERGGGSGRGSGVFGLAIFAFSKAFFRNRLIAFLGPFPNRMMRVGAS